MRATITLGTAGLLIAAGAAAPSMASTGGGGPIDPTKKLPTHKVADRIADLPAPDLSTVNGAPGVPGLTNSGVNSGAGQSPAAVGAFSLPFAPPGPNCPNETQGSDDAVVDGVPCKPAAVSTVVLMSGKVLYWDGLEGMEDVDAGAPAEFGDKAVEDQTRVLDLSGSQPTWGTTYPSSGGPNTSAYPPEYLLPLPSNSPQLLQSTFNDPGIALDALFCADQLFLANGDVLVPGGTHYYSEPHVPNTDYGLIELEGLRNTRIYHPSTNDWTQSGLMHYGRWYPTVVTLGDSRVFVGGGVTKLIKPGYTGHPTDSLVDVRQTETYNPATGTWADNGSAASHSLPLFPRLHMLPDGHVYYDAGGQVWSPFGQSADEALWMFTAVYDPATRSWRYLGVPATVSGLPRTAAQQRDVDAVTQSLNAGRSGQGLLNELSSDSVGFRGSAFSVMLPLAPPYTSAQFLSAGGTQLPTPGTYLANASSVINTVDTAHGDAFSSHATHPLNNARWFSTGVVLPTGQVIAFNGANRDDVLAPGDSFPVKQAELFDPATQTWTPLASSHDDRTYHNTAVLLPSGQILIGGNAPISNSDSFTHNWPGGFSNNFRDPSFEIYNPPYLFWGQRPSITAAPSNLSYGGTVTIATPDAGTVSKVVIARNTALTHVVDADQRTVVLPIVGRTAGTVTVQAPPSSNVAPAGPYLLFLDKASSKGLIPSVGKQVLVGGAGHLAGVAAGAAAGTAPAADHGATAAATGVAARVTGRIGARPAAWSVPLRDLKSEGAYLAGGFALLAAAFLARRRRLSSAARGWT
jgi:hypothetical protein